MTLAKLAVGGFAVAILTVHPVAPQVRLDSQAVSDIFTGFGGNLEALKRGMDACEKLLAENPSHAEALAWHGAATLAQSSVGLSPDLDFQRRVELFKRGTGEMDRAVSLEPDNILVRTARGSILQLLTPGMPKFPNLPGLIDNARLDYQRLFDLQKDRLDRLGTHPLGELLQGLGDLYSRQGKSEEAGKYYGMIQSMLRNTEYAKRAAQWMETKQPLPTAQTMCVGCHTDK